MRVLCVDGDEQALHDTMALCGALSEVDEVEGVAARDALEWLENHPVDVVLLETVLPDWNGIELAKAIKAKRPSMIVIFLTANPEYALEAYSAYPSGFLVKRLD